MIVGVGYRRHLATILTLAILWLVFGQLSIVLNGNSEVAFEFFAFCLAWWLGQYLIGQDPKNPQLLFSGLGFATFALGFAAILLNQFAGEQATDEALAMWGCHYGSFHLFFSLVPYSISYPKRPRSCAGWEAWSEKPLFR